MEIQTRAAVPEDVIAHAWYSLGYRPTASLVFVPADGPIRRTGLVLRANLPPPTHPLELIHHLVQRVADRLVRHGSRSTVLLVASERALQAPPVRLVRSVRTVLRRRGISLREVVGITRRGFRSLACHDRRCCPRSGHPLAAVTASPVAVMHAQAGDTIAEDSPARSTAPIPVPDRAAASLLAKPGRDERPNVASDPVASPTVALDPAPTPAPDLDRAAASPPATPAPGEPPNVAPDPEASQDVAPDPDGDPGIAPHATPHSTAGPDDVPAGPVADPGPEPLVDAADPEPTAAPDTPKHSGGTDPDTPPRPSAGRPAMSAEARDRWWRIWTRALTTGDLPTRHRAGFAAALADPGLRNGVLATAMGAAVDARGPTAIPGWRQAMETEPDDFDLVTCAACVIVLALLEAPPDDRADGLAVLAALTWYSGDPADARRLAVEALRRRRGHGLASTLLALVLTGTPPPWARWSPSPEFLSWLSRGGDLPHGPPGC